MKLTFEKMDTSHAKGVMKIFNHYADHSTAAFAPNAVPEQFYEMILKRSVGYPAYALVENGQVIGFAQLSAYNPMPTFRKTACYTCFIAPDYTGKGIGSKALAKIEEEARTMDIESIISDISSENEGSIRFHEHHGFTRVGELRNIGEKFGRKFSIVLMQKAL